jgi:hypothetical protein
MSNNAEFINGLSFKAPNERAPEYVKAKGSIKRLDLIAWLQSRDGEWVNFDLKVSNGGKWYAAVDSWKPDNKGEKSSQIAPRKATSAPASDDPFTDDIPF